MPEEKGLPDRGLCAGPPAEGGASAGPVGRSRPMKPVTLTDGTEVALRPIRPEDESALTALYERLSPQTAYQRFFTVMRRLPPDWAHILANVDYDRRMAIAAIGPERRADRGRALRLRRAGSGGRDRHRHRGSVAGPGPRETAARRAGRLRGGKGNPPPPGLCPRRQPAHAQAHPAGHDDRGSEAGVGGAFLALGAARAPRAGHRSGRRLDPPDGALTPRWLRRARVAGVPGSRRVETPHADPGRSSRIGKLRVNVAPWPGHGMDVDGPEVVLDDPVAHREPEPGSRGLGRVERLEQVREVLRRDPGPRVRHDETHPPGPRRIASGLDARSRLRPSWLPARW